LQIPLSSSSNDFSINKQGIVMNISASYVSTLDLNFSYFSVVDSMIEEKWMIWLHCFGFKKYSLPFSQEDS